MISQANLDFYIQNELNAMFIGRHGTGKTSSIIEAFNRNKLKWLYFSVATMDPWIDLIGIPNEVVADDGTKYLDLLRPKPFAYDEVEAIFFDEYNRGSDKVRNATMELIQFKSINGKKFNNLKVVWAAVNPEDDIQQYDVMRTDPAQKDRFHVHIEVPYDLDKQYFINKFGQYTADNVYYWWHQLPEEARNQISPRRVEYALMMHQIGGQLRDVLPYDAANVTYLQSVLQNGAISERLERIMANKDTKSAQAIMRNDTEYTEAIKWILEQRDRCEFFMPLINDEKYRALITENLKKPDILKNIACTYNTCDRQHQIILSCYYDQTMKYDIIAAMPDVVSDKFGKNVGTLKSIKIDRGCVDGFVEKVNAFGAIRNHTLAERKEMYNYIRDNVGLKEKGKVGNAALVILYCGKTFNAIKDRAKIQSNFPEIFELMNECLKSENIDIRTDPKYKVQALLLVELGLEDLVWVPSV